MKEKNNVEGLTLLFFKTYHKATGIKTVWYWEKNRRVYEWNRTESRNRPHKYSQLTFEKEAKAIQRSKDGLFKKWWTPI